MIRDIAKLPADSLGHHLFTQGYDFSFFQAVRVLEALFPGKQTLGGSATPQDEIVRFRSLVSLSFPPSQVYDVALPSADFPLPLLTATFFGLIGPSGILPRHYTEMVMRLQRESKEPERFALRDWLDLFNHRLLSQFFRAWKKYRLPIVFEQARRLNQDDPFTSMLLSLAGLGGQGLRNRLQVSYWDPRAQPQQRSLGRIEDLALVFYGGFLAHRPRNAVSLAGMLSDYFRLPIEVREFQGQWLLLGEENQSQLEHANGTLDVDLVIGERVWDVQGKFRVRVGPLSYERFSEFIPDRSPTPQRKAFFLLVQLVRLYVGPDPTFDVQLVLDAPEVPECCLVETADGGPQLGWNTWLTSQEVVDDADEASFEGEEILWTNDEERLAGLGMLR